MKTILTLCIGAISFIGSAQFTVESFNAPDSWSESNFPVIMAPDNDAAADRINSVLHLEMLEKVYDPLDENRFSEVFPPEGEMGGASEFDYEVIANNDRFFSIAISCNYTGAYSEYYTSYFTFDAKSGQRLVLPDLFSESVISDLSDWVNAHIVAKIDAFLAEIDTEDEYGAEQYAMYTECKEWMDGPLYEASFFMTDSTIVFKKGRCSNHAMAALDDLWEFEVDYFQHELKPLMSDNGVALLENNTLNFGGNGLVTNKVMEGKIDGKYPIVAILKHSYDTFYIGYYWYQKVKKPIRLSGDLKDSGTLMLTEDVDDKTTGTMELMVMTDGTLTGTWSDPSGAKRLEMVLEVGD